MIEPPTLSAALQLPEPGLRVVQRVMAQGFQIYQWSEEPAGWALRAPDARLFDDAGEQLGLHDAGPTWQLRDGSHVRGKLLAQEPAPDRLAIPWLLLAVVENAGRGSLAGARFIHRIDTTGGQKPPVPSDGPPRLREARVAYSATYYFWG
ncbi:MAG TPA: DUF3455 domain-containing protein [Polyangia bacterium]|nr:DUF3455 domain-containing protein [Polyangia bacterium]